MGRSIRKRVACVIAAAVGLLALSACGTVDTVMTVNPDLTGSRVMNVTITDTTKGDGTGGTFNGGAAAIQQSIANHLPTGWEFSGVTDTIDTATSSSSYTYHTYTATFTINFSSPQDYTTKVQAALTAGNVSTPASVVMQQGDGTFHTGATLVENFTSGDLLDWVGAGLVADGVLDASAAGSTTIDSSSGTTTVVLDGQTSTQYSNIHVVPDDSTAITGISVATQIAPPTFTRTITMSLAESVYQANQAAYDAFFNKASGQGIQITATDDSNLHIWTAVITSNDTNDLVAKTDQLLGAGAAAINFTTTPNPAGGYIDYAVDSEIDCSAVCSQGSYGNPTTADDQLTVPPDWQTWGGGWRYWLPITGVNVSGDPVNKHQLVFAYTVPTAATTTMDGGLTQMLTPAGGSITTSTSGDNTIYTATMTGSSAADLNSQLSQYLPGSSIDVKDHSNIIKTDYAINLDLNLNQFVSSLKTLSAPIQVDLSSGGSPSIKVQGGSKNGSTVTADSTQTLELSIQSTVNAFSWLAIVIFIVLVLAVLAALFLVIRRMRPSFADGAPKAAKAAKAATPRPPNTPPNGFAMMPRQGLPPAPQPVLPPQGLPPQGPPPQGTAIPTTQVLPPVAPTQVLPPVQGLRPGPDFFAPPNLPPPPPPA